MSINSEEYVCEKCGHKLEDNSPICMYCGHTIPKTQLSKTTIERLEKESKPKESDPTLNAAISVKSFGVILLIIGFLSDIIGMFMVGSSDVDTFKIVLIGGTISFFLGLILTFVG